MAEPSGESRPCPWCSVAVPAGAATCPACGAAVAQRDTIGDLVIPGVTAVHPALEAYDAQPLHIPGPSPTQGFAAGALAVAASGGVTGIAALGGIAAVAAAEYLGARRTDSAEPLDIESLGQPSEAARLMLDRIAREGEPAIPADDAAVRGGAPASGDSAAASVPGDASAPR